MSKICQSIKVEMSEDLSLRGCKINKIAPKSLKLSKNSKILSAKANNITHHHTKVVYTTRYLAKDNNITKAFLVWGYKGE